MTMVIMLKNGLILLALAAILLAGCASAPSVSVKPKTPPEMDICVADYLERAEYPDCVQSALEQWYVMTE